MERMTRDLREGCVCARERDGALINSRATHMPGNHTWASTRLTHADNTALACHTYLCGGVNTEV